MKSRTCAILAASLAMLFAGAASAQPAAPDMSVPPVQAPAASSPFAAATAVDEDELSQTRGGAGMTITSGDNATVAGSVQDGTSTNNTVTNSMTGNSSISDNAFQNSNGFLMVNSNTGNNVVINSSMNVNIVMPPPR